MKLQRLNLNEALFTPLSCTSINHVKAGDPVDSCTSGYNYTLNGQTKTCASDCSRMDNGKWHTWFYDKNGKVMDECDC